MPQVVDERIDDLGIDEPQQTLALIHQSDPNAQRGKHAGVLTADDPAAHDGERVRDVVETQDFVAGEDALTVKRDVGHARGLRADGDDDMLGGEVVFATLVHVANTHRVRIDEFGVGGDQVHIVAVELVADDVDLVADDVVGAEEQVFHGDALFDGVGRAVERALPVAGQIEHSLAQRFAGDGAGVGRHAAHDRPSLDDGDALAQLGRLNRGALPRRAGPDDEHIVLVMGLRCRSLFRFSGRGFFVLLAIFGSGRLCRLVGHIRLSSTTPTLY